MKYTLILMAILALTSCETVSVVSNRAPDGTFVTPTCPKCGLAFDKSATIYLDKNDHAGVSLWSDGTAPMLNQSKLP